MDNDPWLDGKHIQINTNLSKILKTTFGVIGICLTFLLGLLVKVFVAFLNSAHEDNDTETRDISLFDAPGVDPMFDGEYEDWQGRNFTKRMDGKWIDGFGHEYGD